MTGSVNQLGEMQAIGGVNEKIEGFFDVCAARGLSVGSLDAWRYRLRRESASGLVPVVVEPAVVAGAMIELSAGSVTLRLPMSADAVWLATLVRALGSAC